MDAFCWTLGTNDRHMIMQLQGIRFAVVASRSK